MKPITQVMPRDSVQIAQLHCHLFSLECAYWADVDYNRGELAAGYYTEDGIFDFGIDRYEGRSAIAGFYASRRALGTRTSLHIVNNFTLTAWSADAATAQCINTLYAASGKPPLPSQAPAMLTASEIRYVLDGGTWKVRQRLNDVLFKADQNLPFERQRDLLRKNDNSPSK